MRIKESILKDFGSKVQSHRERIGISQERLAEMANVHRTYIGTVERGETNITLYNMYKLADALGINVKELL